jgi:putative two-component system response regulator
MKQNAQKGYDILCHLKHPVMEAEASIAKNYHHHHLLWGVGGYPRGFKGSEIPLEARIISLVDVYDALRSKRPYKPEFDYEKTMSDMLDGGKRTAPSHFDSEFISIF